MIEGARTANSRCLVIGCALMGNPRVLLLDEPSKGLALLIVAEVDHAFRRLKEEGQSIVLVEQNLKLALDIAGQAVILNTGCGVFAGNASELLDNEDLIAQNLGVFHAHPAEPRMSKPSIHSRVEVMS